MPGDGGDGEVVRYACPVAVQPGPGPIIELRPVAGFAAIGGDRIDGHRFRGGGGQIRYGRPLAVSGRLVAPGGLPVAGARLEVLTKHRRPGAAMAHQVDILTGADGRFTYLAPAGPSRTIRIGYRARVGDVTFARTTDVDVRVVASVAFKLSRKRLRNGQTLRYVGRLRGPGTGHRFVEVQVRNGHAWQIVCSVRTDSKGAFACAHRFRRTYRSTTYAFRARVRKQSGLAYEPGASALRRARVRP